ncbi:MAG TPA: SDR family oxidoreductase [Longimicrobiales bacterium]|nr:SDR family oxidoreductase [Longimicrobiales bacterium]
MDLGLRGKFAFVAASSRGLGRAVADELGAEGANVAVCARNEQLIHDVAREIADKHRVKTFAIAADLSEDGEAERAVNAALKEFGRVDVLVTNAGGPAAGKFESHDDQAWSNAIKLNLQSAIGLTRAALPGMKERRWGRIINITSIAVKQPVDNLILSNSVRAAVVGMARTLANEVASFKVTVNNVLPGYTRTERIDELTAFSAKQTGKTEDEIRGVWEQQIPIGRLGEPHEFAALVAFLASERASYITGSSIAVDGGWIKGLL